MTRIASSVLALLALSALAPAAANASFTPLGVVDGLKVRGSSPDGSYIVGQSLDANGDKIAMRWDITGSDPLEDQGELPTGKIESEARAASGDGSVVVGDFKVEDPNDPAKDANEVSYDLASAGSIYAGIALLVWLDRRRSTSLKRAGAAAR